MTRSTTSSRTARLLGSQKPSVRIAPEYSYSDGADAVQLLRMGGLTPDPWQANLLDDWMGRDTEADAWAAAACGLSVPRQNGKTCIVAGRCVAGAIFYSEWIIYTAHLQKTASETFLEIRGLVESPALRKYVKEIKAAIGREQIIFQNGARISFVARTRNGGRGLHGDVLIYDEAQELTSDQQASFIPALAASKNPQTIYLGTPPDENCNGDVFKNLRKKVLGKQTNTTAWTEYSVKSIGDVSDRKRWAATNPAMGRRIKESTIASECEQMAPDTFARERLGWWSEFEQRKDYAIDARKWRACASEELKPEGKTAYGIKFSIDGSEVTLCGAVCPKDGQARISLIDRRNTGEGVQWLADWLNERYGVASCVVIDGKNNVDFLIEKIKPVWKYKSSIVRPKTGDMIAAASMLVNEIGEQTVTWYKPQTALDASATSSIKRPISGGWGFGGEDATPIEAASLALWGCRTSKRDPSRKMRIG